MVIFQTGILTETPFCIRQLETERIIKKMVGWVLKGETEMKKLAILLTMLPLVLLADVAPMSRDEWERHRQFLRAFAPPSFTGCAVAILVGVVLAVGLIVLSKRYSRSWDVSRGQWVVVATLISCCVAVEFAFRPFSSFLSMAREESYEEYLFYERHCRRCGTGLAYDQGRYCPKCHPRKDNSMKTATKADKFNRGNDVPCRN